MIGLATAAQAAQANTIGTYIFAVASGLTVTVLGYIASQLRRYVKEHNWLMETTKINTEAIGQNTEAIKRLLEREERRPQRR